MLGAKEAVQVAKEKAAEMLGERAFNLEEIERDTYKSRDVWDITLSFVQNPENTLAFTTLANLSRNNLRYKRFLIASDDGDLVAIKLREVATQ
jgi:hypothetical protein